MPHASNNKSKFWVFTINNYTEENQSDLRALGDDPAVSYLVFGREMGEEQTPHIQGYIEFRTRHTLSRVRRMFPRAHWERRRGSGIEASVYCQKDGDFEEFGVLAISKVWYPSEIN
ncbi:MAG: putative viral replication protein [Circoviridae sp.]|nr:MAG: putative viral replication protein [Circoviridae sp.]